MKRKLGAGCKIAVAFQIINIILRIFAMIFVLYFVIGIACASFGYRQTDKYRDYVSVHPQLKWDEYGARATRLYDRIKGIDNCKDHSIDYYTIQNLNHEDFIGAKLNTYVFGTVNLVMVSPDLDFSLWEDWSIKEMQFSKHGEITLIVDDKSVTDDFKAFVQATEESKYDKGSAAEKTVINTDGIRMVIYFEESDFVYWEARIYTTHYSDGSICAKIVMEHFDDYPLTQQTYIEITEGTPFYDAVIKAVED